MNPLELVKKTTKYVMENTKNVKINQEKVQNFKFLEDQIWDFESVSFK
jgi:hypothetical protein